MWVVRRNTARHTCVVGKVHTHRAQTNTRAQPHNATPGVPTTPHLQPQLQETQDRGNRLFRNVGGVIVYRREVVIAALRCGEMGILTF